MENTISLLMSIFIPLYCMGYVWLIKVARTDKLLYSLLESRIISTVASLAGNTIFISVLLAAYYWNEPDKRNDFLLLILIYTAIGWHTFKSRNFFRDIVKLSHEEKDGK